MRMPLCSMQLAMVQEKYTHVGPEILIMQALASHVILVPYAPWATHHLTSDVMPDLPGSSDHSDACSRAAQGYAAPQISRAWYR